PSVVAGPLHPATGARLGLPILPHPGRAIAPGKRQYPAALATAGPARFPRILRDQPQTHAKLARSSSSRRPDPGFKSAGGRENSAKRLYSGAAAGGALRLSSDTPGISAAGFAELFLP